MSEQSTATLVRDLLRQALELYRDNARAAAWIRGHIARLDEPLRIAVLGRPGSGRSTLADALAADPSIRESAAIDVPTVDTDKPDQSIKAGCADADAVLHLLPSPYRGGCETLRLAHEHPVAARIPVGSLTVISRADELGAGRIDAMIAARQVARRYRNEPEIRDLSQDAVAVSGLLAAAAAALGDEDFAALSALAGVARTEMDEQLLSTDRFTRGESTLPLATSVRASLLRRYGIFGIRLATTLIRQGADTAPALAAQLSQRSGRTELGGSIRHYFIERADILKARAGLIALDVVLRREPHPAAARLLGELDRVLAGAHEYQELRLLGDLGTERLVLDDELADEAARLIGVEGTHPARRLALDADYPPAHPRYQQAVFGALWRWREHAENPMFSTAQRCAAATVVRSCEAMAAAALAE